MTQGRRKGESVYIHRSHPTTRREAFALYMKRQREEEAQRAAKEMQRKREIAERLRREAELREAAFDGDLPRVFDLLEKFKINVDTPDANGDSALSEAASGGHPEVIQELVKRGAFVNVRGRFDRTPIFRGSFAGHAAAVKELLRSGADPRIFDSEGVSAIEASCIAYQLGDSEPPANS